jgi:hypothetical protein
LVLKRLTATRTSRHAQSGVNRSGRNTFPFFRPAYLARQWRYCDTAALAPWLERVDSRARLAVRWNRCAGTLLQTDYAQGDVTRSAYQLRKPFVTRFRTRNSCIINAEHYKGISSGWCEGRRS